MQGSQIVVLVAHDMQLLNTFHPDWWVLCFTDLFYRGDFKVPPRFSLRSWGAALLKRRDFAGWAASKELAATIHNIVARRTQMWHVHRYLLKSQHAHQIEDSLQSIYPGDFVRAALAAGDCESIRSALRKKNIDTTVKDILKSMDVALRGVEGSESERDVFRFKFISLYM